MIIPQDSTSPPLAYFEARLDNVMNAMAPKQTTSGGPWPPALPRNTVPGPKTPGPGDAQHPLHPLAASTGPALMGPWVSTREKPMTRPQGSRWSFHEKPLDMVSLRSFQCQYAWIQEELLLGWVKWSRFQVQGTERRRPSCHCFQERASPAST